MRWCTIVDASVERAAVSRLHPALTGRYHPREWQPCTPQMPVEQQRLALRDEGIPGTSGLSAAPGPQLDGGHPDQCFSDTSLRAAAEPHSQSAMTKRVSLTRSPGRRWQTATAMARHDDYGDEPCRGDSTLALEGRGRRPLVPAQPDPCHR